jgi:hypothetical protein
MMKLILLEIVVNFASFIEPEGSLARSQIHATGTSPRADVSSILAEKSFTFKKYIRITRLIRTHGLQ